MQLKRECIRIFSGKFLIHPRVRGMDVLVLKVGPQVKPMPDLDICVWAMMGKNIVLELPEPCRGDLNRFPNNFSKTMLHKLLNIG